MRTVISISARDLPDPGIEPRCPVLQGDSLAINKTGKYHVKFPS